MLETQAVTLGAVADFINGDRSKNYPKQEDRVPQGIPFVNAADLVDGTVRFDTAEKITEEAFDRLSSGKTDIGDLLFCLRGSPGRVARNRAGLAAIASSLVILRAKEDVDERYLFYLLSGPEIQGRCAALNNGSAQPNVSAQALKSLEVDLPPLSEQRTIAGVLGSLDDKIELNRRMNRTLESMARALFKSWFVDFDPVHANAAGQPTLPPDLAALFPASFEPSALGEIPEGWKVRSIGDIGQVICGKTPSTNDPTNFGGNIPFVTIPDMHGKTFVGATRRYLSKSGAATQIRKQLPSGAICVSCIATPGLVVMTTEPSQTNQQINSIIPKIMDHRYFWLSAVQRQGDAIVSGGSGGSVFHNLNKSRFEKLRIISPPGTVIEAYCDATSPIFARLRANSAECDTLVSLRDALLPKLLGGKLPAIYR